MSDKLAFKRNVLDSCSCTKPFLYNQSISSTSTTSSFYDLYLPLAKKASFEPCISRHATLLDEHLKENVWALAPFLLPCWHNIYMLTTHQHRSWKVATLAACLFALCLNSANRIGICRAITRGSSWLLIVTKQHLLTACLLNLGVEGTLSVKLLYARSFSCCCILRCPAFFNGTVPSSSKISLYACDYQTPLECTLSFYDFISYFAVLARTYLYKEPVKNAVAWFFFYWRTVHPSFFTVCIV